MKAKFFWVYIIVLVFSPFVIASPDRDDIKYTDGKVKKVRDEWVESHNKLVEVVDEKTVQIKELQASVKELQAMVDSLKEGSTIKLEDIGREGDKTAIKANIALWISIPIVIVVCGILCLVFWPRKSKSVSINPALSDKHKCPRCGWEHSPEDTVCRNPNCRTQF